MAYAQGFECIQEHPALERLLQSAENGVRHIMACIPGRCTAQKCLLHMLACDGTGIWLTGVAARVNRLRSVVCALSASGTVNTMRGGRDKNNSQGMEKNMAARAPVQEVSCCPEPLHHAAAAACAPPRFPWRQTQYASISHAGRGRLFPFVPYP